MFKIEVILHQIACYELCDRQSYFSEADESES